ncbi:MAG: glycosyl hydrolase family 30, partial [Clostridia bacterium]|nr:glycosyl hydrolase family 30 [Clostridia bacterium]
MIISSTETARWQAGKETDAKGIALSLGEEQQSVRGFGTCFSELSALALDDLSPEDKAACLDELFDADKCNFNFCRTPMGASDFATDFYSYADTEYDYAMEHFSIDRDKKLLLPLIMEGVSRQ